MGCHKLKWRLEGSAWAPCHVWLIPSCSFFLSFFLIDPPLIYVSTTCIFYMLAWLWLGYVYLLSPFSKFIGHHLHWIVFNIKDWVHYPIFAWSLSESPSPLCPFFLAGCVMGLKPNFPVAPDSIFFFFKQVMIWVSSQFWPFGHVGWVLVFA